MDDIQDDAQLRRGAPGRLASRNICGSVKTHLSYLPTPVAHKIYGVPQTINSANYVYFLALRELSKLSNPKMIEIFTEELLNLHRGQGMDLYWRDSLTCPSEADYLEMVGNKTGGLFRLAIKLMQADSSSNM